MCSARAGPNRPIPGRRRFIISKPAEFRDQTDEQLELFFKDVQTNLFRLRLQSETDSA